MKKLFTFLFCISFSLFAAAQSSVTKVSKKTNNALSNSSVSETNATVAPTENLSLKETEYDFGKIPQGKPVTHNFQFTNSGNIPLALDNVRASCGCTTPEWSRDTVGVGASAIIKVGYNAANEGPFTKLVTVIYNGNQSKQIIIKGEVWKTPVTSAPVNTSLNDLKNEQ